MHHQQDLNSFEELVQKVTSITQETNERFFKIDIKPQFSDTPDNWEDRLESAFY